MDWRAMRPADKGVTVDRLRFFIVTAARSGSTLLAAILADAGADFDMAVPRHWDRTSGALEHPHLWRALRHIAAAEKISVGRPPFGMARMRWNAYRSFGKRRLRETLARARFVKLYGAHKLVRLAFKEGFFPVVILSYRRFEDQALSFGMMHAHATWDSLRENYRNVYSNGRLLLNTFGGCVVCYEQLTDLDDRSWAEPLAAITGLSKERLIAARDRRVESPSPRVEVAWDDDLQTRDIFGALDRLRGRVIPPSTQALRTWNAPRPASTAASWKQRRMSRRASSLDRFAWRVRLAIRDGGVSWTAKTASFLGISVVFLSWPPRPSS
jgi:hypothetical protein